MSVCSGINVYISFASWGGSQYAVLIRNHLEKSDFTVELDIQGISKPRIWDVSTECALQRANVVVAVINRNWYESGVCRAEHTLAQNSHKELLYVLIPQDTADLNSYPEPTDSVILNALSIEKSLNDISSRIIQKYSCHSPDRRIEPKEHTCIPLPNPYVERTELIGLVRRTLTREDRSNSFVALTGPSGSGKSTLERTLCHDTILRSAFLDGVKYINLGPPKTELMSHLRTIGQSIDRSYLDRYHSVAAGGFRLKRLLEKKSMLLILDELHDSCLFELIRGEFPRSMVLFTASSHQNHLDIDAQLIRMPSLNDSESLELLDRLSLHHNTGLTNRTRASLVEHSDGLPLSLLIAGSNAVDSSSSVGELSGVFTKARSTCTEFCADDIPLYRLLDSVLRLLNRTVRKCLRSLVIFPAEVPIPIVLLSKYWSVTEVQSVRYLDELVRRHLLQFICQESVQIHQSVSTFLRDATHSHNIQDLHSTFISNVIGPSSLELNTLVTGRYLTRFLTHHLVGGKDHSRLKATLLNLAWMNAKLTQTSPEELLSEYSECSQDMDIRVVRNALSLSIDVLHRDPDQLATQLYSRLMWCHSTAIDVLKRQIGDLDY